MPGLTGEEHQQKTLAEIVGAAFGKTLDTKSEDFLRELRVNWREARARTRRVGLLLALLPALFILLVDANVSEIAFAGVKLSPGAVQIIATVLPAVIAENFSRYLELHLVMNRYESIHERAYEALHPNQSPLDRALHPPDTYDSSIYEVLLLNQRGWGRGWMLKTNTVAHLVAFLLPIFFTLGAYLTLLAVGDPEPVVFILSVIVGLFFVLRTISLFSVGIFLED